MLKEIKSHIKNFKNFFKIFKKKGPLEIFFENHFIRTIDPVYGVRPATMAGTGYPTPHTLPCCHTLTINVLFISWLFPCLIIA